MATRNTTKDDTMIDKHVIFMATYGKTNRTRQAIVISTRVKVNLIGGAGNTG